MKNLLPIGSVVLLKEAEKSLMVCGTMQKDDTNKEFDYIGVLFPEGYINSDLFFLFNNEDIHEIKYIGYINAESQVYRKRLEKLVDSIHKDNLKKDDDNDN